MNDTIAAISTPPGTGGIAVIRISGEAAVEIADRIFTGKSLKDAPSHTVHYGFIKDADGEKIDEVLVTVMLAPRTFTREDTVEISCHGGYAATRAVLDAVICAGARTAEPGEFTKRAFLNGRIDLSQAEAVIDVINARNDMYRRNALSQLGGTLSKEIRAIRGDLVHLEARMQVIIDYPDEDLEDVTTADMSRICRDCAERAGKLLESAKSGRIIREGLRVAIAGKPNVGKSSILNRLSQSDRAIVTDIAGTTRDVIEESVTVRGIPLVLTDTAGIRQTDDAVEKIGVERSRQYIESADLVLVVLDCTNRLTEQDEDVLAAAKDKPRMILLNKSDLPGVLTASQLRGDDSNDIPTVSVSAKTGEGMDRLSDEIEKLCRLDKITGGTVITNARHKAALTEARDALMCAADALDAGVPSDIASIDITAAAAALGEITGETVSESVVNDIFHNFCVGK